MYAVALVVALPAIYIFGFGPVARLTYAWPKAGYTVLWIYAPILELPQDDFCREFFCWYGSRWLPDNEGIVVPIYSGRPDYRAREPIFATPRAGVGRTAEVPVFYLRNEFDDPPKANGASPDVEADAFVDGLGKWPYSPEARAINVHLGVTDGRAGEGKKCGRKIRRLACAGQFGIPQRSFCLRFFCLHERVADKKDRSHPQITQIFAD